MNREWAIALVRQKGNRLDQLRLRRALGEPYALVEAEKVLAPYQFPDGGWDYHAPEEDPDRIGSLGGSIHCLRWLREFGLGAGLQVARTVEFLASIRSPDGSFYETEAKLAHSPQRWLKEETLIDRFYFTAAVPMRLFPLGYADHPMIESALEWLERRWGDWRLVTSSWYNLWALLCIHSAVAGLGESQYRRCYATALGWLPNLEAQPLTWLLDALHGAGFSVDEPLVTKSMARLLTLQGEEGAWSDPPHSLEATITAWRLLHDYEMGGQDESDGEML